MKGNNDSVFGFTRSNHGILSVPMSLVIITIISTIIISLFIVSANFMQSTIEKERIKTSLNSLIDRISTMASYATEENRITTKITIPESVDNIIFGNKNDNQSSIEHNTSSNSYDSYCMIICEFKDGDFFVLHSPIGFCDKNGEPLICPSGKQTLVFQLDHQYSEVFAVGSIH
ncbi:MAG: hypothetical protein KGY67_06295 [Candidatus Thermoplasmatota archaeon]|nr:hypothetical protein [Candidatus Thermoplasmatota archaeon]